MFEKQNFDIVEKYLEFCSHDKHLLKDSKIEQMTQSHEEDIYKTLISIVAKFHWDHQGNDSTIGNGYK